MKKYAFAALAVLFAVGIALIAVFGVRASAKMQAVRYSVNEPYNYPVKPGDDEWDAMSIEERLEACRVDSETAKNMDTHSLMLTVLDYPFIVDIGFYTHAGEGIEKVRAGFAPLDELLNRSDASDILNEYVREVEKGGNIKDADYSIATHYHIAQSILEYVGNN